MNSLSRYLGMLKGEAVDHVPRIPILMQFAAEHIGSNYGAFASDYRVLAEANRRCAVDFGMDQVSAISDPYRETQGFGAEILYVKDGVPRCPHHPLEDHKDLSKLKRPDPLKSERMLDRVNAIREFKRTVGGQASIMGWVEGPAAEAADLRTPTNFLMDLMDDGPFVSRLMDRCLEVAIDFARAQIEAGADTIGIGDAIASQVSADLYTQFIQPREKRLVQAIQAAGGIVRLHICGNILHLLTGIAGLGVDILDVDHMVDLAEVRKAVGSRVALAGNIDPANGVRFGSPSSIRERICADYRKAGNPFMVNAGCEIPAGTPVENLKALCEPVPYRA
jgi:MtaA/CmuA family methyltransferase